MKNAFEYEAELAALREELEQWQQLVGHICATIPTAAIVASTENGQSTVGYFKNIHERLTAAEQRNAALEIALKFYADGDHLLLADPDEWDTCSGEPINWLHDAAGTASVEDGSVAKQALTKPTESGASEVAKRALSFENQRITPARFKCLACGAYHEGSGNLPCPKMSPMSGASE